jgi:hypothetical protein
MSLDLSILPEEIRIIIFKYFISNFLFEKKLQIEFQVGLQIRSNFKSKANYKLDF